MQVHVGRPIVVARIALANAVAEGTAARRQHEVLRTRAAPVIGVGVGPRHAAVHPERALPTSFHPARTLVAEVERSGLRRALAVAIATPASPAPREVAVVHVVGIAHERVTRVAKGLHRRQANAVAPVGTDAHVGVHLQSLAGRTLRHKLEHKVVVAIINARQARQVAFLVVGFHLVNHIRRQILHYRLIVARHEVATVHLETFHLLAIDGDATVVVNLRTRQHFDERLYDRTFRHAKRIGIKNHCIILHNHLRHIGCHHSLADDHSLSLHSHVAQCQGSAVALRQAFRQRLIAQERSLQHIGTRPYSTQHKPTGLVGKRADNEGRISAFALCREFVKLQRGTRQGLTALAVDNTSHHRPFLGRRGQYPKQWHEDKENDSLHNFLTHSPPFRQKRNERFFRFLTSCGSKMI